MSKIMGYMTTHFLKKESLLKMHMNFEICMHGR